VLLRVLVCLTCMHCAARLGRITKTFLKWSLDFEVGASEFSQAGSVPFSEAMIGLIGGRVQRRASSWPRRSSRQRMRL